MAGRPRIADSVLDLIGNTPLVRLNRLPGTGSATVLAKVESQNPGGSVKDRIARSMIEDAERRGVLPAGSTLVEPTSGNTGIGLALVAVVKGYRLILTMPDDMSLERRRLLARLGAELVLTPAIEGMTGAVFAAQELCRTNPGYVMLQQFENPGEPGCPSPDHRPRDPRGHGRPGGRVRGGGRHGGTITGVGEVLRQRVPRARMVAVEPALAGPLGGKARVHGIQGIGASFVPGILNRAVIDEVVQVKDEDAMARRAPSGSGGRAPRGDLRRGQRVGGPRGGRAPRPGPDRGDGPVRHRRAVPERAAGSRRAVRSGRGHSHGCERVHPDALPARDDERGAGRHRGGRRAGAFDRLEGRFEGLRGLVRDAGGQVHHHVNVYVNGEEIGSLEGGRPG